MQKIKLNFYYHIIISIFFITIIFMIDRVTKILAQAMLSSGEKIFVINNYINIVSSWNTGISFGMLKNVHSYFFILISLIIVVCLVCFLIKYYDDFFFRIVLTLIIGGAFGNMYDRLFCGAVYDFIDLHVNNYHWPIFNFADIVITIGGILFFLITFRREV